MKCVWIGILLALLSCSQVSGEDGKIKPKEFEVTFTVKYNSISLEEAARKEKVFREMYKDACVVDLLVKEAILDVWVVDSTDAYRMIHQRYDSSYESD